MGHIHSYKRMKLITCYEFHISALIIIQVPDSIFIFIYFLN